MIAGFPNLIDLLRQCDPAGVRRQPLYMVGSSELPADRPPMVSVKLHCPAAYSIGHDH